MKRLIVLSALASLSLALAASAETAPKAQSPAPAAHAAGTKAHMAAHHQTAAFDAKTVETLSGEVVEVMGATKKDPMVCLQVKTDKETIAVKLGPEAFLGKQSTQIKAHDQVEVTGSRVTVQGKATILASQVKKGSDVLTLRDAKGTPACPA